MTEAAAFYNEVWWILQASRIGHTIDYRYNAAFAKAERVTYSDSFCLYQIQMGFNAGTYCEDTDKYEWGGSGHSLLDTHGLENTVQYLLLEDNHAN